MRSIERIEDLGAAAAETLAALGVPNVSVTIGDGSRGIPEFAPYDAIAVHAASPEAPHSLLAQLADGGRLVAPVATSDVDLLTLFTRRGGELRQQVVGPTRFVPLIGDEGFDAP